MAIKMTKLSRKPNGDWFARKGIPSDARESYKLAFGKSHEERFRRSSAMPAARAKIEFSDWLAEIEERIDQLRPSGEAAPQSLTQRQAHALIGRWYDWFTAAKGDEGLTVEAVDDIYERYCTVIESGIRSLDPVLDEDEDYQERTPIHAAHVRAFVTAFSEVDPFMAAEGVSLYIVMDRKVATAMSSSDRWKARPSQREVCGYYPPEILFEIIRIPSAIFSSGIEEYPSLKNSVG